MKSFVPLATICLIVAFLVHEARAQAVPAPAPASSSSVKKPIIPTSGCAPKCLKVEGERAGDPGINHPDPLKAQMGARKATRKKASVNPAATPAVPVAPRAAPVAPAAPLPQPGQ